MVLGVGALEFRLLGTLEVVDGERLVNLGTVKHKALLAILLLRANDVVSTDALIDELWGGDPPGSAISTLRGYMSNLRQALEPGVRAERHELLATRAGGYLLTVSPDHIDAARFERLVGEANQQLRHEDWESASATFGEALALWRGPALGDFAYHSFAQAEAARLAELRLGANEGRMTAELARGHHREVVAELVAVAGLNPFREHLWALLMIALYRSGRQSEALRTYQVVRRALAEELGIEPSAELRDLERAILVQDPGLAWPSLAEPAVARPPDKPFPLPQVLAGADRTGFVGRHEEAGRLRRLWSEAAAGSRQIVFISGEAGIGKSRLATEVAREANSGGAVVLYGRCDEELLVPHQPFMEALRHYVESSRPQDLEVHLGVTGPELTRLLPEIRRRLPGLPEPTPAQPETERYRLFEAVTDLLGDIATSTPLLLVLDDLHWADRPTLLLLRHLLVRGDSGVPLLVLGIHRDDEPGATGGLAAVLADVARRHQVERVALTGLSDDDIATVLEASGGFGPGSERLAVARAIQRETDGNPLFVEEVVHHLHDSGLLDQGAGAGGGTDITGAIGVPEGVRQAVTRRLSRLSPDARRALSVASVIGPQVELDLLQAASGIGEDELLDAIEQIVATRLMAELPESGTTYNFCHAVVRDSIYSGLAGARRSQLHAKVAAALEQRPDAEDELAALAYHLGRAGAAADATKAVEYARRAAGHALSQVAYEQAAHHYEMALQAARRLPTADLGLRCELLLSLGDSHNKAGELTKAKAVFLEAADVARRLGDAEQLGRAALGYGGPVPIAAYVEDPLTVALVREALDALADRDSPCRALLLSRLAQWLYRSGSHEERAALCARALDIARRLDDPQILACVLSDRNWALFGPVDLNARIVTGSEIIELGRGLGNSELVLQGMQSLVHSYLESGDIPAFKATVQARDRLAQEVRQPQYLWNVVVSQALDAIVEGRFSEADQLVERALVVRYQADPRQASNVYLAQKFILLWLQGRLAEQAEALTKLVQTYPSQTVQRSIAAWFLAEVGRVDDARAQLGALNAEMLATVPRDLDFYPVVAGASMASARLDDPRLAGTLYEVLLPYASRNCIVGQSSFLGAASYYLGVLAELLGRPELAIGHFEVALARHNAMAARPFVALTQHGLSRVMDKVGRAHSDGRAEELAGAAHATATELGMASLVRDAGAAGDRGVTVTRR